MSPEMPQVRLIERQLCASALVLLILLKRLPEEVDNEYIKAHIFIVPGTSNEFMRAITLKQRGEGIGKGVAYFSTGIRSIPEQGNPSLQIYLSIDERTTDSIEQLIDEGEISEDLPWASYEFTPSGVITKVIGVPLDLEDPRPLYREVEAYDRAINTKALRASVENFEEYELIGTVLRKMLGGLQTTNI